jgi:polysaccharide biosynthesis PFTS motif protein
LTFIVLKIKPIILFLYTNLQAPLIKKILNYLKPSKINKKRMRFLFRGYKKYNSKNNKRLNRLKEHLTNIPINLITNKPNRLLLDECGDFAELAIRQYMLLRIANFSFNRAILISIGSGKPLVYPIPLQWRLVLKQHGIRVSNISSLLWAFYIFAAWLYGCYKILAILSSSLFRLKTPCLNTDEPYVYFNGLTLRNLPIESSESFDIISWYKKWPGRDKDSFRYAFSIKGIDNISLKNSLFNIETGPLPALGLSEMPMFLIKSVYLIIMSFIGLLFGRWVNGFILNQGVMLIHASCLNPKKLAREYLFHNSGWIYRPLWTYPLERLGSKITFYFYSSNLEKIKKPGVKTTVDWGYGAMTWPRYLVWDDNQEKFIKKATGNRKKIIMKVGFIWFEDSKEDLSIINSENIAVFDVTPTRKSRHCILNGDADYYSSENSKKFLSDLEYVISNTKYKIFFKSKRKANAYTSKAYIKLLDQFSSNVCFKFINPEIAATKIINQSVAVISMPFTSTALIAKEIGKPSVFYDPSSTISKSDPARHGIKILQGIDELKEWVETLGKT